MSDESAKPNPPKESEKVQEKQKFKMFNASFTIEIAGRQNQNWVCPITKKNMRGRWSRENHAEMSADHDSPASAIRRMPDLPGLRIEVNTQRKLVRVFDPLGGPDKDKGERATAIIESLFKTRQGPEKEERFENCSDELLKSWMYWVRRLVDSRQCDVRSGEVPPMNEIMAIPGKIIKENFESDLTDDQRYRPMAPEEAGVR